MFEHPREFRTLGWMAIGLMAASALLLVGSTFGLCSAVDTAPWTIVAVGVLCFLGSFVALCFGGLVLVAIRCFHLLLDIANRLPRLNECEGSDH